MFRIEKTKLYEISKSSLSEYWGENKNKLKYEFCIHLIQYACGKYYDYERVKTGKAHSQEALETYRKTNKTSSKAFQFQRLLFGYRIDLRPTITKLSSIKANKKGDVVKDHIIGTSLIGFYVIFMFKNELRTKLKIGKKEKPFETLSKQKYEEEWFNIICEVAEDFSESWLEKNLCLWAQCRITKKEHDKDNLVRGWGVEEQKIKTDEERLKIVFQRLNLEHYSNTKKGEEIIIEEYQRVRL